MLTALAWTAAPQLLLMQGCHNMLADQKGVHPIEGPAL